MIKNTNADQLNSINKVMQTTQTAKTAAAEKIIAEKAPREDSFVKSPDMKQEETGIYSSKDGLIYSEDTYCVPHYIGKKATYRKPRNCRRGKYRQNSKRFGNSELYRTVSEVKKSHKVCKSCIKCGNKRTFNHKSYFTFSHFRSPARIYNMRPLICHSAHFRGDPHVL